MRMGSRPAALHRQPLAGRALAAPARRRHCYRPRAEAAPAEVATTSPAAQQKLFSELQELLVEYKRAPPSVVSCLMLLLREARWLPACLLHSQP